jgi:general secretion pathway protein D
LILSVPARTSGPCRKSARRANCAVLALLCLVAAGVGGPARAAPARYTYAFKDADLADAAEAILGRALNLTYSIDPDLTGKITFRIDRTMTPPELLEAFESTLALQDIVVVKNGQTLVLEKRAKAKASSTLQAAGSGPHAIGYQTLAVPLTNASPQEVAKALQSMGQSAVVSYVDEARGQIVLAGTAQEVEAAMRTIHMFDRDTAVGSKMRWFPLQHAQAADVAQDLAELLRSAHIEGASVTPMKRLKGVYVFARTEAGLDQVAGLVAKLDIGGGGGGDDLANALWIYHPHNASAEGLKSALSGVLGISGGQDQGARNDERRSSDSGAGRTGGGTIPFGVSSAGSMGSGASGLSGVNGGAFGGSTTGSGGGVSSLSSGSGAGRGGGSDLQGGAGEASVGALGGGVRIGVDKDTNTLLVSATEPQWRQIQKLLVELDRLPGEILIEASIIEVTLTRDNNFGVNFSALAGRNWTTTFSSNSSSTIAPNYPGLAITYLDGNLHAAISALGADSKIEVISAPKIITLDNKAATLNVGDQVPVVTQSAVSTDTTSAPVVNSVDYRNTGVILKVTPRITGTDTILLDVSQEVSSVEPTTSSSINSPTIQQRELESTVILNDGGVVALGGMITSSKSTGNTGIPVLMNVPGLGSLFRSTTNNLDRTELIILITAKIIHNRAESDKTKDEMLTDMKALKGNGGLHP